MELGVWGVPWVGQWNGGVVVPSTRDNMVTEAGACTPDLWCFVGVNKIDEKIVLTRSRVLWYTGARA